MLAEQCDVVMGVDTHRDTHTAAFVDRLGGVGDTLVITADRARLPDTARSGRTSAPDGGCGPSKAPAATARA